MPASEQDYSKIEKYKKSAMASKELGSQYESGSFVLGDKVMEAVRADRATRGVSKLATDVGNVMGQMVTDPNQIRSSTSGLVDPFSVNALTSNARAQNLRTLGTTSAWESANQGSIDEVIQAGANQLKARAQQAYAQAERDMAQAQMLQEEWNRSMAEREFAFRQEQAKASGSGDADFAKLFSSVMGFDGAGGGTAPTGVNFDEDGEENYMQGVPTSPIPDVKPFNIWESLGALFSPQTHPENYDSSGRVIGPRRWGTNRGGARQK